MEAAEPLEASPDDHEVDRVASEHRVALLAGRLNAIQAELVDEIAKIIESDAWRGDGIRSVSHWLTLHLGITSSQAQRLEATARRLCEFPLIADKFRSGSLSHDQTHAVVTDAPAWADLHAYELVQHATVSQIRRIMRTQFPHHLGGEPIIAIEATNEEPLDNSLAPTELDDGRSTNDLATDDRAIANLEDDASSPFRQHFTSRWTDDGRFVGSFDLAAPDGIVVDAVIREARDALFRDRRPHTWADAFTEVAKRATDVATTERVDRHTMYLHIDTDTDPTPDGTPVTTLSNGVRLPPAVATYLGCDTSVRAVWETDHLPLGVGTTTRTIPNRLRRMIGRRDHGCRAPGCASTIVEIHHIQHWKDGGPTEFADLISLCSQHHQMHHDGRLNISGNPNDDTLTFRDRHNRPLRFGPRPIPPTEAERRWLVEPNLGENDVGKHGHRSGESRADALKRARFRHPSGERLHLRLLSEWRPPDEYRSLGRSDAAAWEEHQRRSRHLRIVPSPSSNHDDPAPSSPPTQLDPTADEL